MARELLACNSAIVQQNFDMTVITRLFDNRTVAQLINPAIA
jgi:hypothetical protein